MIRAAEVSQDRVDDVRHAIKIGDEIRAKVINIDLRNRVVWLSIKQGEQESEAEAHREYQRQTAEDARTTTFGELIRSQLKKQDSDEDDLEATTEELDDIEDVKTQVEEEKATEEKAKTESKDDSED